MTAIILPVIAYTIYLERSLKENEDLFKQVQENQLEAILFSVNQYSDDIIKGIEYKLRYLDTSDSLTTAVLSSYPGIADIALYDFESQNLQFFSERGDSAVQQVESMIEKKPELIEKLILYKKSGFTKLQPMEPIAGDTYNYLLMIVGEESQWKLAILLINPVDFIELFLASKMHQITKDQYIITARHSVDKQLIFATDSFEIPEALAKPFWLLPNYELGIVGKGDSIQSVSRERRSLNKISVIALGVFLLVGFILIARNIRKEMQLAQMKSDFASSVSHEIRTPLALINMFAETLLLNRVKTEEKKREYYEIISKETARLKNIVNKILNFSQLESEKRTFELMEESLNDILKETLHTYSFHLENKGFTFTVDYQDNLPHILCDREALIEAIINLIDNAIKYSGEERQIKLLTGLQDRMAYIAVQDFGIGIDAAKQKLIFDKFFRVTHGDVYHVQGAGLGLSIVKQIMDAHEGRIELESKPGKGSTFKLLFPKNKTAK